MPKEKSDILYGIHPVVEALKAGRRTFHDIFIIKGKNQHRIQRALKQAEKLNIQVKTIPPGKMAEKAGSDLHQGICANVSPYPVVDIQEIISPSASVFKAPFLLLIDGVEDPQNLGALVRTALGAGVNGIIIPKHHAASPSPSVSKASAGALEHIKIAKVTNMVNTISDLKKEAIWIMGADTSAPTPFFSTDFSIPLAIIIGSEGKGIRPLVKKHCDLMFSIPNNGPVNSLNASAAGAIVMYEVVRQRMTSENL